MKFLGLFRSLARMLILPVAALSMSCAQPDRWGIFKTDSHPPIVHQEGDAYISIDHEIRLQMIETPPFALAAEGPVDLSAEQAIMLALQNNRDLHVRQINPIIAGTFEQIERGRFDPELFSELEVAKERASETARSTGTRFSVEGGETTAAAGIRQEMPTGTRLEISVKHDRNTSNRTPEQQAARVGLSLTQSLLRGFGPAVNLVSIRQAGLESVASLYELRGFSEALLSDTEIAYWNYVLSQQEIEIFEQSLSVARQQLDEVMLRIEVGILPEIEAAAARAEVARHEQALIDARSLLEENRLQLLRLINPDPRGQLNLEINATSKPAIEPRPITDLADRLQLAERSRPDLNEALLRLKQNRLETVLTRNGLLPRLDLFIALGQTGYADTFSDAFRGLDGNTYDFTAGIRLSHFLSNRSAKALDRSARASRQQAAEAVGNLRQVVQLNVRLAINEVERARQQISATRVTRILQEETLSAEKERFDVGSGTALLVAQAQRDLLASRIAEVEAIINYRIALVKLYLAEGSLLEHRGVMLAFSGQSNGTVMIGDPP